MAEREYNGDGYVNHTPSVDVSAGSVVVKGELITVADVDIAANTLGAVAYEGVYLFAKEDTEAMNDGDIVYWSVANSNITTTVGSNKQAGYVVGDYLAADTQVSVLLGR